MLGPSEEIDVFLANLMSAARQTPAVEHGQYGRYFWEPPGVSLVDQRFSAVDSHRMIFIWTTVRPIFCSLYAVAEGKAMDFPFLCLRDYYRVCRVLCNLAARQLPPEVANTPCSCCEYYPGSLHRVAGALWGV